MGNNSWSNVDGAARGIRDPHSMPNVDRLVQALRRQPGITEITLGFVFTPSDFFTDIRGQWSRHLNWTHRIAEVIRTALGRGLIRAVPTSSPKHTAYYVIETTDPEYGIAPNQVLPPVPA